MGRQVAVRMSPAGEAAFLAFLNADGPVRLFRLAAPATPDLPVVSFADCPDPSATFLIWNTRFSWTPVVRPVQAERGGVRIAEHTWAPVLEYARNLYGASAPMGRIYWPRVLPQPNPHAYDVDAFAVWYERVVRWVRREGRRTAHPQAGSGYVLQTRSAG